MVKNHLLKKGLGAGIVVLLICLAAVPSSNAQTSFSKTLLKNDLKPASENRSYVNFTMPAVNIYYNFIKWKWGEVELDDFTPDFDVNYSSLGADFIYIGFNQSVQCHTKAQLLPAWYQITVEFLWNGSLIDGFSEATVATLKRNWTKQEHFGYCALWKDMYNNIDVQGRITVTGYPTRPFFLPYLTMPSSLFWFFVDGRILLPFEERHGTTAEFTIHVHS